jgi:hypothetical protein
MSHTTILAVDHKGDLNELCTLRNGWGSAPAVWRELFETRRGFSYMMSDEVAELIRAPFSPNLDLNESECWALGMTFDNIIVHPYHALTAAKMINAFFSSSTTAVFVNHWPEISRILAEDPRGGIAINHTSVGDTDILGRYDENADAHVPYNIHKQDVHTWLTPEKIEEWRAA